MEQLKSSKVKAQLIKAHMSNLEICLDSENIDSSIEFIEAVKNTKKLCDEIIDNVSCASERLQIATDALI